MLDKTLLNNITEQITETLLKKNKDYGDSYFELREEYGKIAFLIRLSDKIARLKTLAKQDAQVNESEEDTIKDIIGYCLLELYFRAEYQNGKNNNKGGAHKTMQKYLTFEIKGYLFAVPVELVFDITKYQPLQKPHGINSYIEGSLNFRGNDYTIINFKKFLDICETQKSKQIIFIENSNNNIGLLVDKVVGITLIYNDEINQTLAKYLFLDNEAIKGITKKENQYIAILDVEKLCDQTIGQTVS